MKKQYWCSTMKNILHLCSWTAAHIFLSFKKRVVVVLCTLFILFIIIRCCLMCTDTCSRMHIKNICNKYSIGTTVGSLCQDLCKAEKSSSIFSFYQEMEAGNLLNESVVIKKVAVADDLAYLVDTGRRKFPSEEEFTQMVKNTVKNKFNISLNSSEALKLSYIRNKQENVSRQIEMQNVWSLLQDNGYLALLLYEKYDVFPKLLQTCGEIYTVQYLESISGYWHLMTLYDSAEEWDRRITTALMILDYLLLLDEKVPEPIYMCSVKMGDFGINRDSKKVIYQNVDAVHPRSVVDRITGDKSECKQHSDCDYLDCRSFCNLISQKCDHGVVNNNLQIVCERIFLGWVISGRVMVPGLLLGPRSPKVLIDLLDSCANPERAPGTPRAPAAKEIRNRLYDWLTALKLMSVG